MMFGCLRSAKLNIFCMISFLLVVQVMISSDSIISYDVSVNPDAVEISHHLHKAHELYTKTADGDVDLRLFEESHVAGRLDSEITEFFRRNQCSVQFFMTWIAPIESFGERELLALESLFRSNPESCLIVLSTTMDSNEGSNRLYPLIEMGFYIRAISPELSSLFNSTPAERWLDEIKNGTKKPGIIPLPHNLSNLIRLAALYKYGGVYLDTDFIILKDLSSLRNSIGTQSVGSNGKWTRLNNAILVFDKNHQLVFKFMVEFASTYDGNIWGYNGPQLITRVVNRVAEKGDFNFTVLPRMAFYPVSYSWIHTFFTRPRGPAGKIWVEAKIRELRSATFGVHLWNRKSRRLRIEEGSIIRRLICDDCVLC